MSTLVFVVFCFLLSTETILTCIGNSFTMCVFLKKRQTLQKAYYLLINVAIADLMVGIQGIISLATQSVPFLIEQLTIERILETLHSYGQLRFVLLVVSYILSVVQVLDPIFAGEPTSVTILSSLCVVCTSYVIIGRQLRRPFPVFDNQTRRDMEGNLKLSKTLFMVIGLSLIWWVPAALLYAVHYVYQNCISQIVMLATTALHLAISIVNPVVYSYRMPMLKKELKRCLNKCNFLQHTGN